MWTLCKLASHKASQAELQAFIATEDSKEPRIRVENLLVNRGVSLRPSARDLPLAPRVRVLREKALGPMQLDAAQWL